MADYAAAAEHALDNPDPWTGFCWLINKICAMQAADAGLKDLIAMRVPASSAVDELRNRALTEPGAPHPASATARHTAFRLRLRRRSHVALRQRRNCAELATRRPTRGGGSRLHDRRLPADSSAHPEICSVTETTPGWVRGRNGQAQRPSRHEERRSSWRERGRVDRAYRSGATCRRDPEASPRLVAAIPVDSSGTETKNQSRTRPPDCSNITTWRSRWILRTNSVRPHERRLATNHREARTRPFLRRQARGRLGRLPCRNAHPAPCSQRSRWGC